LVNLNGYPTAVNDTGFVLVGRLPYASGVDVSGESVFLSLRVYLYLCWVVGVGGWGYYGTGGWYDILW
jgi:hypothetical protein